MTTESNQNKNMNLVECKLYILILSPLYVCLINFDRDFSDTLTVEQGEMTRVLELKVSAHTRYTSHPLFAMKLSDMDGIIVSYLQIHTLE